MNYALIENGIVKNIIYLNPKNAAEFPNAVELNGRGVRAGDTYVDGDFYRDGERILTPAQQLQRELADMQSALALLGVNANG